MQLKSSTNHPQSTTSNNIIPNDVNQVEYLQDDPWLAQSQNWQALYERIMENLGNTEPFVIPFDPVNTMTHDESQVQDSGTSVAELEQPITDLSPPEGWEQELDQLIEDLTPSEESQLLVQQSSAEELVPSTPMEQDIVSSEVLYVHWQCHARSLKQNEVGNLLNLTVYDPDTKEEYWVLVPHHIISPSERQNLLQMGPDNLLYLEGSSFDDSSYVILADQILVIPEAPKNSLMSFYRSTTYQSTMRLTSTIEHLIRQYFVDQRFTSYQTPPHLSQLIQGQMLVNGYFRRVYNFNCQTIGGSRYPTFTLHLEMETAENNYQTLLDVIMNLFRYVQKQLYQHHKNLVQTVRQEVSTCPPTALRCPWIRVTYEQACQWLGRPDQLQTEFKSGEIQWLANIIQKSYHTNLFLIEQYPQSLRPYFVAPVPKSNSECPIPPASDHLTQSFDLIYRGERLGTGGQRIIDPDQLAENLSTYQGEIENPDEYLNSFNWGPPPQAGIHLNLGPDLFQLFW